jgi:exopolysaccharide biosynthesis polyprenyl glycosylphosphotransferase
MNSKHVTFNFDNVSEAPTNFLSTVASICSLHRMRYLMVFFALLGDVVLLSAALYLANYLYFQFSISSENMLIYQEFLLVYLGVRVFINFFFGLYNTESFELRTAVSWSVAEAVVIGCMIELAVAGTAILYLDPDVYKLSRGVILVKIPIEILMLALWRISVVSVNMRRGLLQHKTLLVGLGKDGLDLINGCEGVRSRRIVGYVDHSPCEGIKNSSVPYMGTPDQMAQALESADINEVLVMDHNDFRSQVLQLITRNEVSIKIRPKSLESIYIKKILVEVSGVPFVEVNRSMTSISTVLSKRLFEVVLSAMILLMLSPFLAILWLYFRLFQGGDMIYSQERVGLYGKLFPIYKIRTMVKDAEKDTGAVLCTGRDSRVLAIGWILRRTHLDELPQLWNILVGHMSLVGPRPERPDRVNEFQKKNQLYQLRHVVRPGIAGLAQIKAQYDTDFEYKLFYDLMYAFNMSFIEDIRLLYLTPKYLFGELLGEKNKY